jgi:hypothetical protein
MLNYLLGLLAVGLTVGTTGHSDGNQPFRLIVQPRILTLTSPTGTKRPVCLAMFRNTENNFIVKGVVDVGPSKSCSKTPTDYIISEKTAELRGMDTFRPKFLGNENEKTTIGNVEYHLASVPSAVIYKTTNSSGKEIFDAVCVAIGKGVSDPSVVISIAYRRSNSTDPIEDFKSKVECEGLGYATRNELKLVKPDFIGSPAELSATSSHPQLIQSGVSIGLPVSETHK